MEEKRSWNYQDQKLINKSSPI